ncbi:MAG TPA: GNAT family N-acetyltransferase [Gemmataceae bacterium]|nr:GNAT family N-acetyltransferase [Gemmataceae bacterium]
MNPSLTLRPIRPDDEEFLRRVYAGTRAEELAPLAWDDAQKMAFLRMQFDLQHRYYQAQFPDAAYSVVLLDGEPVGRLYVDRGEKEICILDIALLPERRGAGLGGTLLRDLLAEADRAAKPVRIHVERFNPALRLYQRLGFVQIGETDFYYLMKRTPGAGGS